MCYPEFDTQTLTDKYIKASLLTLDMLTAPQLKRLQEADYRIFGPNMHSAVKLCHWCKQSIKSGEKKVCYKQLFYGIKSHRCLQMTPCLPLCNLRCTHCWRDHSYFKPAAEGPLDDAKTVAEQSMEAQRKLLVGLGGVEHSATHLKEAMEPTNAAISLDGEPTLYPYLDDLIAEYQKRKMTVFLVSNGMRPDVLQGLTNLPFQLYISLTSPNQAFFDKTQHPIAPAGWEKLLETLELLPNIGCRTVVRLTLAKGFNLEGTVSEFAKLILKASPTFVEPKAFMPIGASRARLPFEAMPSHDEIIKFSEELAKETGYKLAGESKPSRVALLKK
jgi:tRNA wybutosine-synthesizing protein 1